MNTRTTSVVGLVLTSLFVGLTQAGAATLRPRPLGFMMPRQVPLLADPSTVGDLLPPDLAAGKTAPAARPADDETVLALRESGLSPAQIREVAQNSKAWNERVARRAGRVPAGEKDELAKKDKARRLKLPFGRR